MKSLLERMNDPSVLIPCSVRALTRVKLVDKGATNMASAIPIEEVYKVCSSFDREKVEEVLSETSWFKRDKDMVWVDLVESLVGLPLPLIVDGFLSKK